MARNLLLSISVIVGRLDTSAVKLDSVGAGDIIDDLLLHVAVWCLYIAALVVILGGGVDLVGGVTDPILASEALLDLVSLLKSLVVDGLNQAAHQLVHIEANSLNVSLNDPSAIFVQHNFVMLIVLGVASLLNVMLILVHEDGLLYLVTVGVLVDTITSDIGLPNLWFIMLSWSRSRVRSWRWWWLSDRVRSNYLGVDY